MTITHWPKQPPVLSAEQEDARERWVLLWHEQLPEHYSIIERFNHSYPARLGQPAGTRTLEIGAGIGGHLPFERLTEQEYHVLELRSEFCQRLRAQLAPERVHQGNIEERTSFPDGFFGRVVAIHVLEHIRNLPAAVAEVDRLLAPGGFFDVVLPCEGGIAYSLARAVSAKPLFERTFKMNYGPIIANEHVSTLSEIKTVFGERFRIARERHFPLGLPSDALNLCVGYRLEKRRPA
jgi:SAM-dependent methyltransferase